MTWAHGPVVTRRRLGGELKRLRDGAGLRLEEVATALECSTSKISRLENGKGIPRRRDVRDMLDVYGVTDLEVRGRLEEWAHTGQRRMWWKDYSDVLSPGYDTYVELEWDAATICAFEPTVIHGLLQTPDYARSVLDGIWGATHAPGDVERMVEVRRERQKALEADHGLHFRCILDESTLHRVVRSPSVMRAQVQRLVDLATVDHVELRVLPFSAGIVAAGRSPFAVLDFSEGIEHGVVHLERSDGTRFLSEPSDIPPYRERFAALGAAALSAVDSLPLLERALRRLTDG